MRVATEPTSFDGLFDTLLAAPTGAARRGVRGEIRERAAGAASALACGLAHPDCRIRWEVVNLLGELAVPETASTVVESALGEAEVHTRWRSFWALTRFDRNLTEPPLLDALSTAPEPARWRAAVALSLLGRREAVPRLLLGLDESDTWTVWEALSSLTALRPARATTAVARLTDPRIEPSLRRQATLALGAIGDVRATGALERLVNDRDPAIRWRAASGLARSGRKSAIGTIRRRLGVENDSEARSYMRQDLARLESSHGIEESRDP